MQLQALRNLSIAAVLFVAVIASAYGAHAEDDATAEKYPLGLELSVLERDLTSQDYRDVLETMIPTDLAAEWLRIGAPGNYLAFAEQHGGLETIAADPELKAAYDRRKELSDRFLALMRESYEKRKRPVPFDDAAVEKLLREAGNPTEARQAELDVPVRVAMPAPGAEHEWPRFRGPTGQGIAVEPDFPLQWSRTENVLWETKLPGKGASSPVIWGDRLFVTAASEGGAERLMLCYSRDTGDLIWKQAAPPAAEAEKLYWKNSYASSTPVTDGEHVIAFFGNSGIACWDMEGTPLWQQPLGPFTTMHGPGTSPVLYKDRVIFIQYQNEGESVFVAFDKHTGNKLWQHPLGNAMCWSTPVILRVGEHDELVYNGSENVVGYDPETGEELWRASGSSIEAIPTIVVGGGLMFSTSGRNGPTLALRPGGQGDVTETHIVWQSKRGGPHVPSPAYLDGRLYLVNDTGIVTCLDAATGKSVWQDRLRGKFSASPIEAGGKLILLSEAGMAYVLQAGGELNVLAENDLEETTLATPAVLDGRIWFRTESALLCVGSAQPTASR